jgi:hypothetical protein
MARHVLLGLWMVAVIGWTPLRLVLGMEVFFQLLVAMWTDSFFAWWRAGLHFALFCGLTYWVMYIPHPWERARQALR